MVVGGRRRVKGVVGTGAGVRGGACRWCVVVCGGVVVVSGVGGWWCGVGRVEGGGRWWEEVGGCGRLWVGG